MCLAKLSRWFRKRVRSWIYDHTEELKFEPDVGPMMPRYEEEDKNKRE